MKQGFNSTAMSLATYREFQSASEFLRLKILGGYVFNLLQEGEPMPLEVLSKIVSVLNVPVNADHTYQLFGTTQFVLRFNECYSVLYCHSEPQDTRHIFFPVPRSVSRPFVSEAL